MHKKPLKRPLNKIKMSLNLGEKKDYMVPAFKRSVQFN